MIELEVISPGAAPAVVEVPSGTIEAALAAARSAVGDNSAIVFEKDCDEALADIEGRTSIAVVVHKCHRVDVSVRFEHRTLSHRFSPAARVDRVLRWAVGKHGFNLDEVQQAKANLIVPGTAAPLDRDAAIGQFTAAGTCNVLVDLTLADFTNG